MRTILCRITHAGEISPAVSVLQDSIGDAITFANDIAVDRAASKADHIAAGKAIDVLYDLYSALGDTIKLPVDAPPRYNVFTRLDDSKTLAKGCEHVLGHEVWGKHTIVQRSKTVFIVLAPESGVMIGGADTLEAARDLADDDAKEDVGIAESIMRLNTTRNW